MRIRINGTEKELPDSFNLRDTVTRFCKDARHVIAELNGTIIRQDNWDNSPLREGDTLELVNFVGGG